MNSGIDLLKKSNSIQVFFLFTAGEYCFNNFWLAYVSSICLRLLFTIRFVIPPKNRDFLEIKSKSKLDNISLLFDVSAAAIQISKFFFSDINNSLFFLYIIFSFFAKVLYIVDYVQVADKYHELKKNKHFYLYIFIVLLLQVIFAVSLYMVAKKYSYLCFLPTIIDISSFNIIYNYLYISKD